jgi:4-hydroxy-L-threonine phosphate dehydrogenase PdxA
MSEAIPPATVCVCLRSVKDNFKCYTLCLSRSSSAVLTIPCLKSILKVGFIPFTGHEGP